MGGNRCCKVTVTNKLGLHIRPSRYLAELVRQYDAQVEVRNNERTASADSQLDLLMLVATQGTVLEIEGTGPDAEIAIAAMIDLIEDGFGENP